MEITFWMLITACAVAGVFGLIAGFVLGIFSVFFYSYKKVTEEEIIKNLVVPEKK